MKRESPPALRFLDGALADLERRHLLRTRRPPPPEGRVSFCSNDYLGLAARASLPRPTGAGASRLVDGERAEHRELEGLAAALVGAAEALSFTSGYAANVGTVAALAGPEDLIISDAFNHASLIDGARLSRARVEIVPHLDVGAVRRALQSWTSGGRAFVITESYFSMDADGPDLKALRRECDAREAVLMVDEAHALGVLGPNGAGRCAEAGVAADVIVGTFGKAFGAGGAFVAGAPSLIAWLWNRARSFVFSTGLSPTVASSAADGIRTSLRSPRLRERALEAATELRLGLQGIGVNPAGFGPIVPWIIGDPAKALRIAELVRRRGIDVLAIRPPSVPDGTARIRLTVSAAHERADIEIAIGAIKGALEDLASGRTEAEWEDS